MKIGFVGAAGDMASLYARILHGKGHEILVSDTDKERLRQEYAGLEVRICENNKEAARLSDLLVYSTPIAETPEIIRESAPFLRENAVVGGFTSVKTYEVDALLNYAPDDSEIITFHPMHGPSLKPGNQKFIIIPVRTNRNSRIKEIEEIVKSTGINISYVDSVSEHDRIMADTQVLTHFTFLSMGNAWRMLGFHPEENSTYQNEVDRIKTLFTKRILSQNPEVYAGIAVFNPEAKRHVRQYVSSLDSIMELVLKEETEKLLEKWCSIVQFLGEDELKISDESISNLFNQEYIIENQTNSYLSQFVLGDSFMQLGIKPKDNLAFQSPPYKILSLLAHKILNGNAEHCINNAIRNLETKRHDYYFCKSATVFAEIVESGNYQGFVDFFKKSAEFFGGKELEKARAETDKLIERLANL